jgi:hypothetical protein
MWVHNLFLQTKTPLNWGVLAKLNSLLAVDQVVHTCKQEVNTGAVPVASNKVVDSTVDKKAN